MVEGRHVGVLKHLHDLQLSILETLVLQHLLYRNLLPGLLDDGLVDDAERAAPNHMLVDEGPLRGVVGVG